MEIFEGQNLIEFSERFKTEENCKEYLSKIKWSLGYKCRKCGHTRSQERADFSRTCNRCSDTESSSVDTLFHRVKFGLRKAFFICFEMTTTTKSLSAKQMEVRYGITEKTARLFMMKVRQAMKSSENYPMDGEVHIDEFVLGGHETGKVGRSYDSKKKKTVCAVQFTKEGKIKRMYALKITDFSAKSLETIFTKHIDPLAKVTTDSWRGYTPIAKKYTIKQILSNKGLNFPALHTMIHQLKSWIRTTYSWVSNFNINRYYDEFCFRINRSQSKNTIFNTLIIRMVKHEKMELSHFVCS